MAWGIKRHISRFLSCVHVLQSDDENGWPAALPQAARVSSCLLSVDFMEMDRLSYYMYDSKCTCASLVCRKWSGHAKPTACNGHTFSCMHHWTFVMTFTNLLESLIKLFGMESRHVGLHHVCNDVTTSCLHH